MEHSISSLTFRGSISEAIVEAKKQKKLFVVYISGEDEQSKHLEQSTWMDVNVANSMSKYCIFLHLCQGSIGASQFTAIYPQKSIPCITAIGYNGVKLWEHEGYVSSESLISSIEKAWFTLHFQETTATFLTATLASEKSDSLTSSSSIAKMEEESSSSSGQSSSLTNKLVQDLEAKPSNIPEQAEENSGSVSRNENKEVASLSFQINELDSGGDEVSTSLTETSKVAKDPVSTNPGKSEVKSSFQESPEKISFKDRDSGFATGSSLETSFHDEDSAQKNPEDKVDNVKSTDRLNYAYLNIRLVDGTSLQEKISVTDTLRLVKGYVDQNQTSSIGPYDLAIPYPRKVFNEQDLSKTLAELELFDRQALIVVPHRKPTELQNQATAATNINPSDDRNGGYFGYVKKIFSYINPFAYLGGSSSDSSNDGMWQYRPSATMVQNNISSMERPSYMRPAASTSSQPSNGDGRNSRRPPSSRFGSNIHTLKHDEDDIPSGDRNTFWNGNSTQYGGNDDHK